MNFISFSVQTVQTGLGESDSDVLNWESPFLCNMQYHIISAVENLKAKDEYFCNVPLQ